MKSKTRGKVPPLPEGATAVAVAVVVVVPNGLFFLSSLVPPALYAVTTNESGFNLGGVFCFCGMGRGKGGVVLVSAVRLHCGAPAAGRRTGFVSHRFGAGAGAGAGPAAVHHQETRSHFL